MIINHNLSAMNAHRNMGVNTNNASKSMEKLSSGLRINRAGDDAAGLAISEKMRGQIRGLDQASRNSQDGISMIQTAEGALNETHSILQRMRELAVQAGNDTNTAEDRGQIQQEINQLTSEINRIGNTTEFNNQKLLQGKDGTTTTKAVRTDGGLKITADKGGKDGNEIGLEVTAGTAGNITITVNATTNKISVVAGTSVTQEQLAKALNEHSVAGKLIDVTTASGAEKVGTVADGKLAGGTGEEFSAKLQIGANKDQSFTIEIGDVRASALGLTGTGEGFTGSNTVTNGTDDTKSEAALDVSNHENAAKSIEVINNAINSVSTERSKMGAMQNRLEHTIANLDTSAENLQASESRIRDVDMADEMLKFSKDNILQQASQAMLAQAKQAPQGVLQLLR